MTRTKSSRLDRLLRAFVVVDKKASQGLSGGLRLGYTPSTEGGPQLAVSRIGVRPSIVEIETIKKSLVGVIERAQWRWVTIEQSELEVRPRRDGRTDYIIRLTWQERESNELAII